MNTIRVNDLINNQVSASPDQLYRAEEAEVDLSALGVSLAR